MPSSRKRRWMSPDVLAYAVAPVALGALLLLRVYSLISDEPVWKYLVVLGGGAVASTTTNWYFRRHTGLVALHARLFVQAGCVTMAIYVTGWGPALAVTYAFMAPATGAECGARAWRATAFWSVAWIGIGQVAIAFGWAPTLLEVPLVHGLAAVNALGVVMVVRMSGAVTEQKERAEAALREREVALEHQALHDGLTGLPNRIRLLDRLDHAIARAARHPIEAPAVVFLDIDHFKLINDGLGHEAGDDLLTQVGERLQQAMRPADTVARFGGDEFVLVCEGVAGLGAAEALGRRVLGCFEQAFAIRGEHFVVSASVGVALLDGAASASDLVRHADEAMYRAKAHGRNRAEVFIGFVEAEELPQPA